MLAALARELPADEGNWAAEMKWDGMRAIAYLRGSGDLRLRSRSGRDVTAGYPDLAGLAAAAGNRQLILDGEIVAFRSGVPRFADLQRRMAAQRPGPRLASAVPATYLLFDVLHLDGQSLLHTPYWRRRELLEGLRLPGPGVDVPPGFPGAGQAALAASSQHGLEGIVLKRLDLALCAAALAAVAQAQASPVAAGRDRRMGPRARPPGPADRIAAARCPRPGGPGVLRAGLDGLLRRRLARDGPPAGRHRAAGQPVRYRGPGRAGPARALGAPGPRRRGHLHRVDSRRAAQAPGLARAAHRRRPGQHPPRLLSSPAPLPPPGRARPRPATGRLRACLRSRRLPARPRRR